MVIFTAKLTKKRMVIGSIVLGVMLISAIFLVSLFHAGMLLPTYGRAGSEQERLDFMRSFGWEVDPQSVTQNEVLIPRVFDEVYNRYNEMQIEQGLDLRHLAGRTVTHYSYLVQNHPSGEEGVLINLLVYKEHVVGGDVMSPRLDGWMAPLTPPNG